jgi:C-terminal processing protease CtpA/Prc
MFVKNLNEIKAKGGVERVVIDESTNGGGYVLMMGKLMALMSKNNNADMYMKNDITGTVMKYSVQVDSNNDGIYDTNDCFGQYFKFYLVTSAYSFSCGNAFPFYAQNDGIAQLVGTRTGGGECSVESIQLPFGQTIIHSSDWHIGLYDAETKVFTGDEEGASPMLIPTFNQYDVNKMSEFLKNRE